MAIELQDVEVCIRAHRKIESVLNASNLVLALMEPIKSANAVARITLDSEYYSCKVVVNGSGVDFMVLQNRVESFIRLLGCNTVRIDVRVSRMVEHGVTQDSEWIELEDDLVRADLLAEVYGADNEDDYDLSWQVLVRALLDGQLNNHVRWDAPCID